MKSIRRGIGSLGITVMSLGAALTWSCGSSGGGEPASTVFFDLDGPLAQSTYFNLPFPSDLRLTAAGQPDLTGYPNPRFAPILTNLLTSAANRAGWPMMPIAYFRFTDAPPARDPKDFIAAAATSDVLILNIDPNSADRGKLTPAVAQTLTQDGFSPNFLVAVAPVPGMVLSPKTEYAVVLRKAFSPTAEAPTEISDLAAGNTPAGKLGAAAATLYAPLWTTLTTLSIPASDVLAATVFTTGDDHAVLRARTELVRQKYTATIGALQLGPTGASYDGFCELRGTVSYPQFQTGTQPFNTDGVFEFDADGTPTHQGDMTVPLTIALPNGEMPAGGWPMYQFFHGSGGISTDIIDLGYTPTPTGTPTPGEGPAWVVARYGIATVSAALPVNPERLSNASDYAYLNLENLVAFPFTFQQGVIEQRLLLDALLQLDIPADVIAQCPGVTVASGGDGKFDAAHVVGGGQSMGGMYSNLIGAVEGRYGAMVPTGAGGFWNLMILQTALIPGAKDFLATLFATDADTLSFLHPGMALLGLGWEIADPMVAMSRLERQPLEGLTTRNIYEPVGAGDMYFPEAVYDAAALSYGNQEVGDMVWPDMQTSLAVDNLQGFATYPVSNNRPNATGTGMHTGVVVQYTGDGIIDAHYLYRQNINVKHQYACFLHTFLSTGIATVPGPGQLSDPCD